MPQQKKNLLRIDNDDWKPDLDRFLSISALNQGKIVINGDEVSSDMAEILRTEAHNFMSGILPTVLGSAIANEAARYALEEAKASESADIRSAKLGVAQGLMLANTHWLNFMKRLSKM